MTDFRALCAELVEDIEEWMDGTDHCPPSSVALVNRARAALAQPEPQEPTGRTAIEPVPVAERLPGPEDCLGRPWEGTDAGFCWWFYPGLDGWRLMVATRWEDCTYQNWTPPGTTHWLPHYALPVPQQEAN